jgi:cytochrome c-type biogenesis protein CcmH
MFWLISLLILLIAGLLALSPLLGKGSNWKLATLALILLLPMAAWWLYQQVGTPQALDLVSLRAPEQEPEGLAHAANTDMGTLTERLRLRLEENPDDIQGWILLGRSYKNLQNYPLAIEALEKADSLQPGQPLVQVELVEAELFASGQQGFTPEMTAVLEQAVAADPSVQKGLWLLGIAAAQAGDDARAVSWWEQLLPQVEAGSQVEQMVQSQLAEARSRLGDAPASEPSVAPTSIAPTVVPTSAQAWPGLDIQVELSGAASQAWPQLPPGEVPPGTVLFIIIRPEGAAGSPPLGARRVVQPQFPLQLTLSDQDSMMEQRPISSAPRLELQARLSRSGQPTASAGDWQSAVLAVSSTAGEPAKLNVDQEVK